MKALAYIGVWLGGFIAGFMTFAVISFFAVKFYVDHHVASDEMSQGIAGSLYFICIGLPISGICGLFSGILALVKYVGSNESKEDDIA